MKNFEVCKFEKNEDGSNCVGSVDVRLEIPVILRYKIIKKKDGSGVFYAPPSFKITQNGEDRYLPAFVIDSNYQSDEIRAEIQTFLHNLKEKQRGSLSNPVPPPPAHQDVFQTNSQEDDLPF